MTDKLFQFVALVAALALAVSSGVAVAQRPLARVTDLNQEGMEQYMRLELDSAQATLERALEAARSGRVAGEPLARTYANLGVLSVGGRGDSEAGLDYFIQAIEADPTIELDPLTSSPEIQSVFADAQRRTQAAARAAAGDRLAHLPVPEQRVQTGIPIYIEVPGDPAHVFVHYRASGMRAFRRVEMTQVAEGFGYEIPCTDVLQPRVEYYIAAFAENGSQTGFAGTEGQPFSVEVVEERSGREPALPGMPAPQSCADGECPPGMDGCMSAGGPGSACSEDSDCGSELTCQDRVCVADDDEAQSVGGSPPVFYLQVSGLFSLGFASEGQVADRVGDPANPSASLIQGGMPGCDQQPALYCVRVSREGFVPSGGVRVQAQVYFLDFLGAGVWARFAPGGRGSFSTVHLGARLNLVAADVAFTPEGYDGTAFQLVLFAGGGGGQIQVQPPGNPVVTDPASSMIPEGEEDSPWILSGFGNISAGAAATLRFSRNFGIVFQSDFMFQLPAFLFNIDLSLGVSVSF